MAAVYLIEATERGRIQGSTIEVWGSETVAKRRKEELEKSMSTVELSVRKMTIRTAL